MKQTFNGLVYDTEKMSVLVERDCRRNGLYAGSDRICITKGGNYAFVATANGQDLRREPYIEPLSKGEIAERIAGWELSDEEVATLIEHGVLKEA